jgi:hypothetical protein
MAEKAPKEHAGGGRQRNKLTSSNEQKAKRAAEPPDVRDLRLKGARPQVTGLANDMLMLTGADGVETIHEAALGYTDAASVADNYPGIRDVTDRQVTMAHNQIVAASQAALVRDGFPEEFKVYRTGPLEDVVSVSLHEWGKWSPRTVTVAYAVKRADVLTYMDGLTGSGSLLEQELHVEAKNLRAL